MRLHVWRRPVAAASPHATIINLRALRLAAKTKPARGDLRSGRCIRNELSANIDDSNCNAFLKMCVGFAWTRVKSRATKARRLNCKRHPNSESVLSFLGASRASYFVAQLISRCFVNWSFVSTKQKQSRKLSSRLQRRARSAVADSTEQS